MVRAERKRFIHIDRGDGRIELQCEHGVGHTSLRLMKAVGKPLYPGAGIHGCDGCCATEEFTQEEDRLVLLEEGWDDGA